MSFIPYSRQNVTDEDVDAVTRVLRSDYLTQGPAVTAFEAAFAKRHAVAHAVSVSNATAGLHIACLALGVGPGKRVWTSPNSFLASANCALYCGAEIDFVDIDPSTRNMSVEALDIKLEAASRAGKRPDLVIPVDFAGLPCDLREIRQLADLHGFKILQDASHASGADYLGQPVGSRFADISVFSFHAVKIVTTAEGGIVTTQDAALARQLQLLRSHGMTRNPESFDDQSQGPWYYEQHTLGFNYRMTDVQAALGYSQLKRLESMHDAREARAARYNRLLRKFPLRLSAQLPDRRSAWHLYAVEIDNSCCSIPRLDVFQALRRAEIGVNVHYIPIHLQPYYRRLGFAPGQFPHAERYYANALSLPLFPAMTDAQQDRVVDALREALAA